MVEPVYRIEKGIPLPLPSKTGRPIIYDFGSMKVGDSFNVLIGDNYAPEVRGRIAAAATGYIKRHAPRSKFSTRISERGVRVWRVK